MTRIAALLLALGLSACAAVTSSQPAPRPPGSEPLYEANAMVLDDQRRGPALCFGGIAESYPPQCRGVPLTNWDWDAVQGEERAQGTTWSEYHVVGTYEGEAFTVTHVQPYRPPDPVAGDLVEAGCPEPEGGWVFHDPARTSDADLRATGRVAEAEPDFAGFWIDYIDEPQDAPLEAQRIVATAAFTGDLRRHEEDLREIWGGPLCVVKYARTFRELREIQKDLPAAAEALGLQLLGSGLYVFDNIVEGYVVAVNQEQREALDETFGEGAVRAIPALRPVTQP